MISSQIMYRKSIHTNLLHRLYLLCIVSALICTILLVTMQSRRLLGRGPNASQFSSSQIDGIEIGVSDGFAFQKSSMKLKTHSLPQAIIIGTRKSGTRALLKFLEVNPSVRSASNEIHFFDRPDNYKRGLEWYKEQIPEIADDEIAIEKSPAYFVTSRVPERIKAMNSSIKLIVIFRNPVTRLISDYSQLIANRLSTLNEVALGNGSSSGTHHSDLEIWRNAESEFERHVLRSDGRVDDQRRLIKTGMYSMHLEKWLSIFPRDQFHFVDGERMISEPHVELQKLERFLGISPWIAPEHFVYVPSKRFYCLSGRNITTSLSPEAKNEHKIKPICLSKSKGRRHISVDEGLKRKLVEFYAPYNEYLFSLTNIDFGHAIQTDIIARPN